MEFIIKNNNLYETLLATKDIRMVARSITISRDLDIRCKELQKKTGVRFSNMVEIALEEMLKKINN